SDRRPDDLVRRLAPDRELRPGLAHSPRARQQPGSEVRRRWRSARLIARSPAPVMGAGPFLRSGRTSQPPVQGGPAAVAGRSSYPFSFRASISSIVRARSLGSGRSLVASRGRPSPRSLRSGAASACCSHRSTSTDRSSEPMTYCVVGRFASMHTSQTRIVAIVLDTSLGGLAEWDKNGHFHLSHLDSPVPLLHYRYIEVVSTGAGDTI